MPSSEELRRQISELVAEYHRAAFAPRPFVPGESPVRYASRVFDAEELQMAVEASLDFWLTAGRFTEQFEGTLAERMDRDTCLLVNSGSSANLIAMSALTSPQLKDRRVRPGDEVITVAAGFPTTVNPIIQNRAVPVFVDVELATYLPTLAAIEAAITPKTKAVMIAHTMGVPFDAKAVAEICRQRGLWLVEDCCDALGTRLHGRPVGTFGDFGHGVVLPGAPDHDGRGRGRAGRGRAAGADRPLVPRLGPRLLLQRRREQHLRETLQPAVRHPALRIRPQVCLLARRL